MSEQKKNQNVNPDTEELTEEGLSEQRRIRREKLKNLQEAGRNPYLIETLTARTLKTGLKKWTERKFPLPEE